MLGHSIHNNMIFIPLWVFNTPSKYSKNERVLPEHSDIGGQNEFFKSLTHDV